jgi:DNA-binding CsgD family transcriptional regulator
MAELVEAAVRSGEHPLAEIALDRLTETTSAAGTDWALGIEARCRALVSAGAEAERLYQEAIDRLGRTMIRFQLARTHLVFGEWLRGEHRHPEARKQLRTAYDMFSEFGIDGFAERARAELKATGERTRSHAPGTVAELTSQEAQIARLAASGETNHEIAQRLFLSASTIEYHLRKAFRKLGVTSRNQLAQRLRELEGAPAIRP